MELADRKARAEMLAGREARRFSTTLETRSADGLLHFRGLASSTESPYDMGYYTETIKRGAFAKTLQEQPDVQLLINHDGLPLARTTNGSRTIRETDQGLEFEARADAEDPDAARVARKVDAGLMDQCSFAFRVTRQTWDEDYTERSINEVSLDRGDVSIVNYGANPNTSISARSMFDSLAAMSDEELLEAKEDPAVLTVIRRLGLVVPEIEIPEVTEEIRKDSDNDLYIARLHAIRLRGRAA